jgi:hypothetical protein
MLFIKWLIHFPGFPGRIKHQRLACGVPVFHPQVCKGHLHLDKGVVVVHGSKRENLDIAFTFKNIRFKRAFSFLCRGRGGKEQYGKEKKEEGREKYPVWQPAEEFHVHS